MLTYVFSLPIITRTKMWSSLEKVFENAVISLTIISQTHHKRIVVVNFVFCYFTVSQLLSWRFGFLVKHDRKGIKVWMLHTTTMTATQKLLASLVPITILTFCSVTPASQSQLSIEAQIIRALLQTSIRQLHYPVAPQLLLIMNNTWQILAQNASKFLK